MILPLWHCHPFPIPALSFRESKQVMTLLLVSGKMVANGASLCDGHHTGWEC